MDEMTPAIPDAPPPLGGQTEGVIAAIEAELQRSGDIEAFVGPNTEKFLPLFGLQIGRRRPHLCWPGFFVPLAWFMYRKMYGWAALTCALPIFATALDFGVLRPLMIGAPTFLGLAGRHIYVAQARQTIARIRAAGRFRSEEEMRQTLTSAGGVSTAGAMVGGAIVFCGFATAFVVAFVAAFVAAYHARRH
jgi:hypothetical protein